MTGAKQKNKEGTGSVGEGLFQKERSWKVRENWAGGGYPREHSSLPCPAPAGFSPALGSQQVRVGGTVSVVHSSILHLTV